MMYFEDLNRPGAAPEEPEIFALAEKSFLIVDDFLGMRGILRDLLRNSGVPARNIEMAGNAKEAISQLERMRFDVVLCDFNLGAGRNGQQILEEAVVRKLISPACAWIMITAEKTADVVAGAAEYHPDCYLVKPVTEAVLRRRLERICEKKKAFAEISQALAQKDRAWAIQLCDERLLTDKANASDLLRLKCKLLLAEGDLEAARAEYSSVLAARDTPWAKVGLAQVHFLLKDYLGAKRLLEEVIYDHASYLEAYDLLAQTLAAMGEFGTAETILERATRISPNSVMRQKHLGDVSLQLGKLDNAERAFRKCVTLGENSVLKTPEAYLGLAKTVSRKDNVQEALHVLDKLDKDFDGEDVRLKALSVEGQIWLQAGKPVQANKVAKELGRRLAAGGRQHLDSESALEAARLLLVSGERDTAVELLQDEVRNNHDDRGLLDRIQLLFNAVDLGEEGGEWVETSRKEAVDQMNRGVLLARQGRMTDAIVAMRAARHSMPRNVRVLFNFTHIIIAKMQQDGLDRLLLSEARSALEAANVQAPGDRRFATMTAALDRLAVSAPERLAA